MSNPLLAIRTRLKSALKSTPDARLRRRRALTAIISRWLPFLRFFLFIIGYVWMIALPYRELGRGTYIDENALQPGQVNTYWNWLDVHHADMYLEELERLRDSNASSAEKADYIKTEFQKLGLLADTQNYLFVSNQAPNGTNAYGILPAPRASGTEAMVVSASWLSRAGEGDGTLNLRGVALVLGLASYLRGYSLWAKDIVFVVSDGYLDGMHAWLSTYHGATQSNLRAQPLSLTSGVVWTALNIDYPGHSFSHLGVFYEGLNGRLPNQDLINSFRHIAHRAAGVPVVLYDHAESENADLVPSWVPAPFRENRDLKEYFTKARDVVRHFGYQSRGRASGIHGLFHRYRIDAITLFAIPANGPHGFHAFGKIVESTLRTMNNLLERLHASFFFYLFSSSGTFLKIGNYLPSVILISVALMFTGLQEWVDAGWVQVSEEKSLKKGDSAVVGSAWRTKPRPVLQALIVMIATHAFGLSLFLTISSGWAPFLKHQSDPSRAFITLQSVILFVLLQVSTRAFTRAFGSQFKPDSRAPLATIVKALTLCLASTVITITSLLNFSLAAMFTASIGVPIALASPRGTTFVKQAKSSSYVAMATGILMYFVVGSEDAMRNWELFGVWFAPFMCIVYVPLVLQAALVCAIHS